MENEILKKALYKRYIEPTKKKKEQYIGVEIEMPIVNLSKKAVDFSVVHNVAYTFIRHFGFNITGRDDEGEIYSATEPVSGDILSFDCSYNNLELSFGKEKNLHNIYHRFTEYYKFLQSKFSLHNYTHTGMGINPHRIYNNNVPIPNGRYRMLFHHLHSYKKYTHLPMYFHSYPEYGTFSSASQVQLDVSYNSLPMLLNTFSKLEPIKALLFSNSVMLDKNEDIMCCRDMFWENSTHGINPHNIGMYNYEFSSVEEVVSYIESSSVYCLERDDKYINFPPTELRIFFDKPHITGEYYDNGEYKTAEFSPRLEDIQYLRTFKFVDLTFRGTAEFRSICTQPIRDSLCTAAFHLGLADKLVELSELLEDDRILYHRGYNAGELRKLFIRHDLPELADPDDIYSLARKITDLSYDGLKSRHLGEEIYLAPLYERIERKTNPAKHMLELRNSGKDMRDIILEYADM